MLVAVKKRGFLDRILDLPSNQVAIGTRSVFMKIASDSSAYLCSDMPFKADRLQISPPTRAKSDRIEIGTAQKRITICLGLGLHV